MQKKYVLLLICLSMCSAAIGFTGQSFFLGRPQGVNAARELVGWQSLINRDEEENYHEGVIDVTYAQSFNSYRISNFLFSSLPLTFSGSRSANRGSNDILADYFGLPSDFQSSICFNPLIRDVIVGLDSYYAFNDLLNGVYVRAYMPINYTSWNLRSCESVQDNGTNFYPAGYMGAARINRIDLAPNASTFLSGNATWGDMQDSLAYGKICGARKRTSIADVLMDFGWNWTNESSHAGIFFRLGIPAGNKPTAEFLFDAMVGNGYHWEVGGGLTLHHEFWRNDCHKWAVYLDANLTSLIASWQPRSFDFTANGAGSRYMLLEDFVSPSVDLFFNAAPLAGTAATNQYRRRLLPAINVTTLNAKVSFAIQADIALKFMYSRDNFEFDLGYNFYGRSREKLQCRQSLQSNRYAIKGDTQVYGFDEIDEFAIALNATQSKATLHAGQGNGNANFQNLNVDNPVIAADSVAGLFQLNTADSTALGIAQVIVRTSDPAILLQDSDINNCSALLPRAITHGLFVHANHMWQECECYKPYIGVGGEVEFATGCAQNNSAYSQWQVWLKGGVSY